MKKKKKNEKQKGHSMYECVNSTAVRRYYWSASVCVGNPLASFIITGDGTGGSNIDDFYCGGQDNWVTLGFVAGSPTCQGLKWMSLATGVQVCSHLTNYAEPDTLTRPYPYTDMGLRLKRKMTFFCFICFVCVGKNRDVHNI